ncbi:MAG TPA: hypothetical protein ENG87_05355 [Candidatus Pacearchaeota archaeon]|nr:hypothetical protein BMS3Abin17_00159 [archaeon BMS3Abin17]HDK42784.1 hypothetical protein [Candidatus Pacearchaeota archaeon]
MSTKGVLYILFIFLGISMVSAISGDVIMGDVVQSSVDSSITIGVPSNCSNNITEGAEECDWGGNNGVACSPPYDGSCQYCTLSCEFLNLSGSYCGDGTCDSANETSSSCSADCAAGGGSSSGAGGGDGGGVAVTPKKVYDFYVDKNLLEIELPKGSYVKKKLKVINNGTEELLINVTVTNLGIFISPSMETFVLKIGESRIIEFDIYALESQRADTYVGKINFVEGHVSRSVNIVFDLKEKSSLFDMKTKVIRKYVVPGNRVVADIVIKELGDFGKIRVDLEYSILDFNNVTYGSGKESFVMEESFSKRVFLETSKQDPIGDYIFYSKLTYEDITVSSYDSFKLEKISLLMWLLIIFILIILIIIIMILIKKERERRRAKLAIHESKNQF